MTAYLALLRAHPRVRALLIALAVSVAGDSVYLVLLASMLLGPHHTGAFGLAAAAEALGTLLALPVAGVAADRYDRLRIMIVADAVQAVTMLAAYGAFRAGVVWAAPAVGLVLGAAGGFFTPAGGALLPDLVGQQELTTANSLRSLTVKASALAGPALGGVLLALTSGLPLVLVDAASFAASGLLLTRVAWHGDRPARPAARDPGGSMLRDALAGLAFVRSRAWIATIMLQGVLQVGFVLGPEVVLVPIYLSMRHQTGLYGFVLSAQAAGTIIGALAGPRVRQDRAGLGALCGLLLVAPELTVLALGAPGPLLIITSLLTGAGFAVFGVLWISALQRAVPGRLLGRVLALDALANGSFQPLGTALTPAVLAATSLPALALVLLAGLVLSTVAPVAVPGVVAFRDPAPAPAPDS